MAWYSQFKLGRPGLENLFDLNPDRIEIREAQIAASNRVLSGRKKKLVFRTSFPRITIQSKYFTWAQRNIMASLLGVTDTFLSFQVRDDIQMNLEVNPSTSATTVNLQENSATLLSQTLVAGGYSGVITVNGVWNALTVTAGVTVGSGTNYYTGGSYNDATMAVTLGTPLPAAANVYCSYTYTGWLVDMTEMPYTPMAGQVDVMEYSGWVLEGV